MIRVAALYNLFGRIIHKHHCVKLEPAYDIKRDFDELILGIY